MKEVYPSLESILKALVPLAPEDEALVAKAYKFAEQAHASQKRYSGEPYFAHVAAVGKTLADMKIDRKSTRLNSSHIQKSRMPSSA